ncbi:hypothetical protein BCR32DRAFT_293689 [Anaeromyces robustus]|uniref:Uncharacterized protein n=1 Tax=Anaeromyces robustus TaxID=1754192 RepID=A0A1Y1X4E1_9FUNG|nr:hypothetical protein BCR32DRAFT_293689 [Anaeromyces robustus]|eukprot:ORX80680.1 hypothetical protein BCR32DRAFT_293689 [Anaeromyces robustus]
MGQKKNKSLLRQIQAKLIHLKKYETVSPSLFQDNNVINGTNQTNNYPKISEKDIQILTSPLKKNVRSLKDCFEEAVIRLWLDYCKTMYHIKKVNFLSKDNQFNNVIKAQNIPQSQMKLKLLKSKHHVDSLRELASFALGDAISNKNSIGNNINKDSNLSNSNNDDINKNDFFASIPSYIPNYLNNIIFLEYINNICIEKINTQIILKSLIEVCVSYGAYFQAYKLLKKHFILRPYKNIKVYKFAFETAKLIYKEQAFLKFITENLTIYHIYQPNFIKVIYYLKKENNKKWAFKLVEKSIEILIYYLNNYTNKNSSSLISFYIPTCIKIKIDNDNNSDNNNHTSNFNDSYLPNINIDLNNEKEIDYYFSLCRHYTKMYIEMTSIKEDTIRNFPLSILPRSINSILLKKFNCIFSALMIRHFLNFEDQKYYKYFYSEFYHLLSSNPSNYSKNNKIDLIIKIKNSENWRKCSQYCQKLDYLYIEKLFKFKSNLNQFQVLINIMEKFYFYEEAFSYVNWIYDTLNNDNLSSFITENDEDEEGINRHSKRRRKIVYYYEGNSDEDEKFINSPKARLRLTPRVLSPLTPNKINKQLYILFQKAKSLATIINYYSTDFQWQYEENINSWIKKKRKRKSTYDHKTNIKHFSFNKSIEKSIPSMNNKNKYSKKNETIKNKIIKNKNIIIIDDDNNNDNGNDDDDDDDSYNENKKMNIDNISNNLFFIDINYNNSIINRNNINNKNFEPLEKNIKIIEKDNNADSSDDDDDDDNGSNDDDIKIQEPLPFNDEIDEFLL